MKRNKIIMLFLMVPVASLHAMQGPARGSFEALKKKYELRLEEQRLQNMQRGKEIVEMIRESTTNTTRYRVFFSTGNVGLCTHSSDEQRRSIYSYKEWTPAGAMAIRLDGEEAAMKFKRYTFLHKQWWTLESVKNRESRINYLI